MKSKKTRERKEKEKTYFNLSNKLDAIDEEIKLLKEKRKIAYNEWSSFLDENIEI